MAKFIVHDYGDHIEVVADKLGVGQWGTLQFFDKNGDTVAVFAPTRWQVITRTDSKSPDKCKECRR